MKQTHHKLLAWQMSRQLVRHVYDLTRSMPKAERYGLISQLRRGATSIPAKIAEGAARGTQKEFRHFLLVSRG